VKWPAGLGRSLATSPFGLGLAPNPSPHRAPSSPLCRRQTKGAITAVQPQSFDAAEDSGSAPLLPASCSANCSAMTHVARTFLSAFCAEFGYATAEVHCVS
jgi:hypothetical protein